MSASLTVLGCSGTYGSPGNPCSGFLVEGGGRRVLVDAGPGTLPNLQEHVALDELDAVVLSHQHPDHWLELPVLRNALRYALHHEGLPVYGTAGTLELARAVIGELEPTLAWTTVAAGQQVEVAGMAFSFSRTDHPPETLAMRIDVAGASFAYSADTGPGWGLARLGPGVDLAVCEATFLAHEEEQAGGVHLTTRQAGESAAEAGVGHLVVTHLLPGRDRPTALEEAAAAFGGRTSLANPHERYLP